MDDSHPDSTTVPSAPGPTITTTPSSEAPSQPSKPPTRAPPSASTLQKLRYLVLKHVSRTAQNADRTLLRLAALLSTPSGTDVLLCTISYTLTLVRALLSRLLERRLASIATAIAEKADGILLPGETLIASLPAPASTKLIAQVVGSSKALADTISDFRIFVRMWGLVGMYTWARGTYTSPLPSDASTKEKILRQLTWASIASCVGFQVLENGAYLSSKGALTSATWTGDVGKARENNWWLWSSRFWAVYVGVELARLGVVRFYNEGKRLVDDVVDDGEKEGKLRREERVKQASLENWLWWKDLASNLAYAPMTIHWSLEQGLLSDWGVGACGMVAGGALLLDAWRKTA
ncbi:hypothetical protein IQ07DRAFT_590301 [Pyrenochaeta sp. DS3sAY3a]|nr:hypothetical protein IQ07DRAFT_590301 [Pyrenochaeta sp. DS3sAY3a]